MTKYEYQTKTNEDMRREGKTFSPVSDRINLQSVLNNMGNQGWKLITFDGENYIFLREKELGTS